MWLYKLPVRFSAIHSIRGLRGPDGVPHGHDFKAVICFACQELMPAIDMGVMTRDLVRIGNSVCKDFVHTDINTLPPFDTYNPSLEMLGRYIFEGVMEHLKVFGNPKESSVGGIGVLWVEVSDSSLDSVAVRFVPEEG